MFFGVYFFFLRVSIFSVVQTIGIYEVLCWRKQELAFGEMGFPNFQDTCM